jgi:hypothetical protein
MFKTYEFKRDKRPRLDERVTAHQKKPTIGKFMDREQDELSKSIESDECEFGKSILTPERKAELQQAARNTLNDERLQISLHLYLI